MLFIHTEFDVNTEIFGKMTFSSFMKSLPNELRKIVILPDDDKQVAAKILHCFLKEPKLSAEEIETLPSEILQYIGQELLDKSFISKNLDERVLKDRGFFSAFREAFKKVVHEEESKAKRVVNAFKVVRDLYSRKSAADILSRSAFDILKQSSFSERLREPLGYSAKFAMEEFMKNGTAVNYLSHELSKIDMLPKSVTGITNDHLYNKTQIAWLESMGSANNSIARMLDQAREVHYDLSNKSMREIVDTETIIKSMGHSEFSRLPQYTALNEISQSAYKLMLDIDFRATGRTLPITSSHLKSLGASFRGVTQSYADLYNVISSPGTNRASLDNFIIELPPIEIYTGAALARAISRPTKSNQDFDDSILDKPIVEDVEGNLYDLLSNINPDLLKMLQGAKLALKSENPDRFRHVTVSLRELITQVLHMIAPDNEVRDWTSEPDYFHKGSPTRKARLLFACRHINCGPFTSFVPMDVNSHLKFIDIFQKGTHGPNVSFTDQQMEILIVRTESLLRFLLTISTSSANWH